MRYSFFKPLFFRRRRLKKVLLRYLFRELIVYFFVAFLFFFLIFFVNHILLNASDILEKRVPLHKVALFIFYALPFVIAQSAPFATLVGFLMCIGRMVTDKEFLIMRSCGISPFFILLPVAVTGLAISVFSFTVNDYLLPLGTISYNKLYLSIIVSNPAVELEPHSIKRTRNSTLVVGDVNGSYVSDLLLFDTDSTGQQRVVICSGADILPHNDEAVVMQLDMENALVVFFNPSHKDSFDYMQSNHAVLNIFSSSFMPTFAGINPQEMTSYDLKLKLREMEAPGSGVSKAVRNSYRIEYYRKFSLPFGALFFAVLALPLAALFAQRNGQTVGLVVGVIIAVLYWALMILGQQFGFRNGLNAFFAMWLPNVLVATFACVFFVFLVKE